MFITSLGCISAEAFKLPKLNSLDKINENELHLYIQSMKEKT